MRVKMDIRAGNFNGLKPLDNILLRLATFMRVRPHDKLIPITRTTLIGEELQGLRLRTDELIPVEFQLGDFIAR